MGFTFGIGLEIEIKTKFALKDIRKAQGLSREELAEKSGVAKQNIQRLELSDDPTTAKLSTLIKLAKALGCKVGDFFPQEKYI